LVIKEKVPFAVSTLKFKIKSLAVPILDYEENLVESQPATAALVFKKF